MDKTNDCSLTGLGPVYIWTNLDQTKGFLMLGFGAINKWTKSYLSWSCLGLVLYLDQTGPTDFILLGVGAT